MAKRSQHAASSSTLASLLHLCFAKSKGKTRMFTLNCKGRLLTIDKPAVIGIINITPDSFYSASQQRSVDDALQLAEKMLNEGATILDLGGQSTRPGSERISPNEETDRVVPVIEAIYKNLQ